MQSKSFLVSCILDCIEDRGVSSGFVNNYYFASTFICQDVCMINFAISYIMVVFVVIQEERWGNLNVFDICI